jgi:hypothetical protein
VVITASGKPVRAKPTPIPHLSTAKSAGIHTTTYRMMRQVQRFSLTRLDPYFALTFLKLKGNDNEYADRQQAQGGTA